MAFKRKETATPIKTKAYKFRVFPEYQKPDFPDEIKEGIFREARLMGELWNRLVEIRKNILERYGVIYAEELENAEAEKLSAKELRKISPEFKSRSEELWKDYEREIKAVADDPEMRAKVSWEVREDVINRFESSHKRALKEGGEIRFQSGFIQQWHFPHRFTGGGLAAGQLFTKRSKKIFIETVPEEFYERETYRNRKNRVVSGRFGTGINDALQIPFRVVLHRQIPTDAKIKTANLTGKFKSGRWDYNLVLTVDEPEIIGEPDFKHRTLVGGLDLGWRKFEDYIRFGVLADSAGNLYEFRLPVNPGKKQSLRRLERLLAKHGNKVKEYPQTWQDIEDWQTRNDLALERVKEVVRELDLPENETIKPILQFLVKVRKSGLLRLLRALAEISETFTSGDDGSKAIEILQEWREESSERERAINYARERLINDRNYKYQLISNWLKENFAELAYEGDLKLAEMATKAAHVSLLEENGAILRNSAKFRGRVALHELLQWIKQKERKTEKWLHPKKSAHSTTTCIICGASCEKTPSLEIICDNGHKIDQDAQAATNLRNELADEFPEIKEQILFIPDHLKNIIVPMNL
jgi:hypothetical protein